MPLVCQRDSQELEKGSLTVLRDISFMISGNEYQKAWVKIMRKFSILNKTRKGEKMKNLLNSSQGLKRVLPWPWQQLPCIIGRQWWPLGTGSLKGRRKEREGRNKGGCSFLKHSETPQRFSWGANIKFTHILSQFRKTQKDTFATAKFFHVCTRRDMLASAS